MLSGIGRRRQRWFFLLGLGFGTVLLWLAFRGVNWQEMRKVFSGIHYGKLGVAYLVAVSGCWVRAVQWHMVLRETERVPLVRLFRAIMIGFLWNFSMPARIGEVVRAAVTSRREQLPFTTVVTTVAVTRVLDGAILLSLLAYVLVFASSLVSSKVAGTYATPVRIGAYGLATACVTVLLLLTGLSLWRRKSRQILESIVANILRRGGGRLGWLEALGQRSLGLLDELVRGLEMFRNVRHLIAAVISTIVVWLLGALTIHWVLLAFQVRLPFAGSLFVLVVISIGVALPGAPAYVGQFHAACRYSLIPFGIVAAKAASIATALHLVHFSYTVLLGVISLFLEGVSWGWARRVSNWDRVSGDNDRDDKCSSGDQVVPSCSPERREESPACDRGSP